MINELSKNMLGVIPAQPKRDSATISQVKGGQPVDSRVAQVRDGPALNRTQQAREERLEPHRLDEMVKDLNGLANAVQRQLQFSIDEDNGEVVVKVVDTETKAVIREIPSEEIRNMQKQLSEVSDRLFNRGAGTSLLFKGQA